MKYFFLISILIWHSTSILLAQDKKPVFHEKKINPINKRTQQKKNKTYNSITAEPITPDPIKLNDYYTVNGEESLLSIAIKENVRYEILLRYNFLEDGETPVEGSVLHLRSQGKRKQTIAKQKLIDIDIDYVKQDYIQAYIKEHCREAYTVQQTYGIPADITLSMAILESWSGKHHLARVANNHFGIKCTPLYSKVKYQYLNVCYKRYEKVIGSYIDNAEYLYCNPLYSSLFENYDISDYKNWALGLEKNGYSTIPEYGSILIMLIEKCDIHPYIYQSGDVNPNCSDTFSTSKFQQLLLDFSNTNNDKRISELANKLNKNNCLSIHQANRLVRRVEGDPTRYLLLKIIYPYISDQKRFGELKNTLSSNEWREYFNLIMP